MEQVGKKGRTFITHALDPKSILFGEASKSPWIDVIYKAWWEDSKGELGAHTGPDPATAEWNKIPKIVVSFNASPVKMYAGGGWCMGWWLCSNCLCGKGVHLCAASSVRFLSTTGLSLLASFIRSSLLGPGCTEVELLAGSIQVLPKDYQEVQQSQM